MSISLQVQSPFLESNYVKSFPASTLLVEFKRKIELIAGVYVDDQVLTLLNAEGKFQRELNAESETLEQCGVHEGWIVRVGSRSGAENPQSGDAGRVTIAEDKYAQRGDTARGFLAKVKEQPRPFIKVGERCTVPSKEEPQRQGLIRFVGEVAFKPGEVMVGVELDGPSGKHDGAVEGQRYFHCPPQHGIFVAHRRLQLPILGNANGHDLNTSTELPMEL